MIRNHYDNCFNQINYAPVVMFTSSINQFDKIMQIIILYQIYSTMDAYISRNQIACSNRSTADIIWTYKFQTAFAERYNQAIYLA